MELCNKTKADSSVKKCSNCGGNHTANYRGCPVFAHFKQTMTKKSSFPKQPQLLPHFIPSNNVPDQSTSSKHISYANVVKSNAASSNQEAKPERSEPHFSNLEATLQTLVQSINTFTFFY